MIFLVFQSTLKLINLIDKSFSIFFLTHNTHTHTHTYYTIEIIDRDIYFAKYLL